MAVRLRLRSRNAISFGLFSLLALCGSVAGAHKLDIQGGAYQFSATNNRNSTSKSISGFGSYRFAYRHTLRNQIEVEAGYSLLATDGVGGDLSFGVDIGINYFPLTSSGDVHEQTINTIAVFRSLWRPFVGASFHQRNFQSTASQYAGPGAKIGVEYQITDSLSCSSVVRYLLLGGPNRSEATQIDILGGITFQF